MYPGGVHISRLSQEGSPAETVTGEENTIAFWKSPAGRLRLAAGTMRRKGEVSVLLTKEEADALGKPDN
jgi:hypothetical protein